MSPRVVLVGPVFPYRAGIAYCTTRLAEELGKDFDARISSFRRQYPKRFYPGGDDVDPTLTSRTPSKARFALDVLNPVSWIMEALWIRRTKPDAVIFVWWIWVWAIPYLVIRKLLPGRTFVLLQCHNAGEKEPAWWKTMLSKKVFRAADALVVHAGPERDEAIHRLGGAPVPVVPLFLPVHELGTGLEERAAARARLGFAADEKLALFFGHVRPFKGLDLALRAWKGVEPGARLVVAGEFWWNDEQAYRTIVDEEGIGERVRIEPRFIPDDEIALWFAAADVVLAPYRSEAQSGVALTAFHFRRPVIATAVGGLPEIVEEGTNGFLVAPEAPAALAGAVNRFFALSPARRAAMEDAAAASAGKFSWDRYGSAVGDLLRRAFQTR